MVLWLSLVTLFKSLPDILKMIGEIFVEVHKLQQQSTNGRLADIKSSEDVVMDKVKGAVSDEERKKLALDIATFISK